MTIDRRQILPICTSVFAVALLLGVLGALLSASTAHAQGTEIRVRAGESIQAAIDSATSGDVIIVEPGTYVGGIDYLGKNLSINSLLGPTVTTIDGDQGTGVRIGPGGTFAGFTVMNSFASFGAGMSVQGTGSLILGNVFADNVQSAGGFGAAIAGNVASPTIEANVFRGNSCDGQFTSGVVSFVNNSSPLIVNNLFEDNPCRAINLSLPQGPSPQVLNNTIVRNHTGIRVDRRIDASQKYIANNLIFDNQIGLEIDFGTDAFNPTWRHNLVFGNDVDYDGITDQTGTNGNISVDPLLANAIAGDYELSAVSPAIDVGEANSARPSVDLRGRARITDGSGDGQAIVDIGALEYNDDPCAAMTTDPTVANYVDLSLAVNCYNAQSPSGSHTITLSADMLQPAGLVLAVTQPDPSFDLTVQGFGHAMTLDEGFAIGGGGGVNFWNLTLDESDGNAIAVNAGAGSVSIINTTISQSLLAAVRVEAGEVTIRHSSLLNNSTGLEVTGGAVALSNATLVESEIDATGGSTSVANSSLWHASSAIRGTAGVSVQSSIVVGLTTGCVSAAVDLGNNFSSDAGCGSGFGLLTAADLLQFGKPAPGCTGFGCTAVLPLLVDNPAIDQGQCTNVTLEVGVTGDLLIDGRAADRPFGLACDAGSYEYTGVCFKNTEVSTAPALEQAIGCYNVQEPAGSHTIFIAAPLAFGDSFPPIVQSDTSHSLTLDGQGNTITSPELAIAGDARVTLRNLRLEGTVTTTSPTGELNVEGAVVAGSIVAPSGGVLQVFNSAIVDGSGRGIDLTNAQAAISNSFIARHVLDGVHARDSTVTVSDSIINGNGANGVHHVGATQAGVQLEILNTEISGNQGDGASAENAAVLVSNSTLWGNGSRGLYLLNAASGIVGNSTVATNGVAGIENVASTATVRSSVMINFDGTSAADCIGSIAGQANFTLASDCGPGFLVLSQAEVATFGTFADHGCQSSHSTLVGCPFSLELLPGNPSIQSGECMSAALPSGATGTLIIDQRGAVRDPADCDAGAYELEEVVEPPRILWPQDQSQLVCGDVDMAWTAPADGTYTLMAGTSAGTAEYADVSLGATTSYTLTGLPRDRSPVFVRLSFQPSSGSPAIEVTITYQSCGSANYVPVTPARILDSRNGTGDYFTPWGPGKTRFVELTGKAGVPSEGVTAVVIHVTSVAPTADSFLTVWPSGPRPLAASKNYGPSVGGPFGHTSITNDLLIVPVGPGGTALFYNHAGQVDLVADVVGYLGLGSGSRFTPLTPARIVDSRDGTGGYDTPWPASTQRTISVTNVGGLPSSGVSAVVMNLTSVSPTADSWITAWGSGPPPSTAAKNFGTTIGGPFGLTALTNDLVTVPVSPNGTIELFNQHGSVDLVGDVVGYYSDTGVSSYYPTAPTRILDSRFGTGGYASPWSPTETRAVTVGGLAGVPVGADAVVMHVTSVSPTADSFLTAWAEGPLTLSAAKNYGITVGGPLGLTALTNDLIILPLAPDGTVQFYNEAGSVDFVADVVGYFDTATPPAARVARAELQPAADDLAAVIKRLGGTPNAESSANQTSSTRVNPSPDGG